MERLRQISGEQEINEISNFYGSAWASHLTSSEMETLKEGMSAHKRYPANKRPKDRVESDELNNIIKEIRLWRQRHRNPTEKAADCYYLCSHRILKKRGISSIGTNWKACNLRSLKVKSSSEFQLLILGHLNATLGKKMHEHIPKQVRRFLLEEESSRIWELMTEKITELKLHQQWFL